MPRVRVSAAPGPTKPVQLAFFCARRIQISRRKAVVSVNIVADAIVRSFYGCRERWRK